MKRVLALAGAVFLIAAAIVVRAVIVDDDDDESVGTDGGGDGDLVVACIPELEEACEALDREMVLRIEDPGETIAALSAGDDIDAWVTLDPWPEIADILEQQQFFGAIEPVAHTDLVLMTRALEIPDTCTTPVTWSCLVPEFDNRLAVPQPGSALGLLVLAHAANDFRPNFRGNELREDFALVENIQALGADLRDPAGEMLLFPDPDAAGTTAADFETRITRSAAAPNFTSSPGASPASVAVVVAGRRADRVAGEPSFTNALEELGWDLDPNAATSGLPNAGVLVALAEVAS